MAPGDDIDPTAVISVRAGNRMVPGLAAFTGVSFLAYLLIKVASGSAPFDNGMIAQLVVAAALAGYGGGHLWRARYFFVVVETRDGLRRVEGLTKAEQTALAARLSPAG